MLRDSGLMDDLENYAHSPTGQNMFVWGFCISLEGPLAGIISEMEAFNLS